MRDTIGLIMLSQGIDIPRTSPRTTSTRRLDVLQKQVDSGQIRQFTGNDYLEDLRSGNAIAAIAWSGDILLAQFEEEDPNYVFQLPETGGTLWSDNLLVPIGSPHKTNAEKLIDYYYDPDIAAEVAAYVNYICPVEGAKEEMEKIDPSLVDNPLIFPTAGRPRARSRSSARLTPDGGDDLQRGVPEGDRHLMASESGAAGQDLRLDRVTKRFGTFTAVDDLSPDHPVGVVLRPARRRPAAARRPRCGWSPGSRSRPTGTDPASATDDVTDAKPYKRPVNTVFQSYALFPHLDIFENVAFGLRRRGQQVREDAGRGDARAGRARRAWPAASRRSSPAASSSASRWPGRSSTGPQVLLLDEPLGALDLKLRRQMQLELKRIQTEVGITFVHVTHDQEEAMTMADTIAVMNGGRIEQLGGADRALRDTRRPRSSPTSSASPT